MAFGSTIPGKAASGAAVQAAYGEAGDYYRFYDINPQVVQIARSEFTYLRDTGAHVEIALGDARLSLEREAPENFDVLAVDAFASDAIPVHLLTKQAFQLYFRHLKADGILAVHVSNRYLRLSPVVAQLARELGKEARVIIDNEDDENQISPSEWVLVTANKSLFEMADLRDVAETIPIEPGLRTWTDDYSNLFQILKSDKPGALLQFFKKSD